MYSFFGRFYASNGTICDRAPIKIIRLKGHWQIYRLRWLGMGRMVFQVDFRCFSKRKKNTLEFSFLVSWADGGSARLTARRPTTKRHISARCRAHRNQIIKNSQTKKTWRAERMMHRCSYAYIVAIHWRWKWEHWTWHTLTHPCASTLIV